MADADAASVDGGMVWNVLHAGRRRIKKLGQKLPFVGDVRLVFEKADMGLV